MGEGLSVWSDHTQNILWQLLKMLMLFMTESCELPQCFCNFLHLELALNPVNHQKGFCWASKLEHRGVEEHGLPPLLHHLLGEDMPS